MCLCTYARMFTAPIVYSLLFPSPSWLTVGHSITYSLCRNMKMALVLCATVIFCLLSLSVTQGELFRMLHIYVFTVSYRRSWQRLCRAVLMAGSILKMITKHKIMIVAKPELAWLIFNSILFMNKY